MSLPAWATDPSSLLLTEAEYDALPAEVCRTIEVVDGRVVFCESPTPGHQRVSRNLTMALLAARPTGVADPCIDVLQDTDMRFRSKNPHSTRDGKRFTFRRPDISVLRCLEAGARLWSDDVIVAIEITSSDVEVDFNDKRAEYAAQGIPVYLIVVMDGDRIHSIEEYRLDWSARNYQLVVPHREVLATELPLGMKINVAFEDLERI
ncbi:MULTISPECIES: Uma2 family endonuclease [unclassified Nocardia]|uniref:Uma2 family endonuclease n=1 Tax=unclassified Nocardia TaxID=2637762 RepID=UPI001CE4A173|nr:MULTISPECIES: Uma2 family endonuclease [unclassified Nocardia]